MCRSRSLWRGGARFIVGDVLGDALVRPGCVVVRPVLGQDGEQMPFAEDQHAVEQLTAQGADEPPVAAARTGGGGDRAKLERSLCVRDRSPEATETASG